MMRRLAFLFFLLGLTLISYSQEDSIVVDIDSVNIEFDISDSLEFDDSFETNLDSVTNLYYVKESLKNDPLPEPGSVNPVFSDSVYKMRIENIPSAANLTYNNLVKQYINAYTGKRRDLVEVMLGLSEHYFPVFDDIFDYYGVPNELKYMSIIESALNPRAYSKARAVGLWQFMYGTGRVYGLEINSLVDERRDPIKSTHAAAKFISDLHDMYDDWLLAIAAYNCGPGNVNKAIRRSGGKKSFWEIYYYLPRETRGHVPAFIAATYTMNYYAEHNLKPREIDLPLQADTVMVNQKLHLMQVSEVLNIPIKQLQDLNPQYTYDIIPGNIKPYALRLPVNDALSFIDLQDSIFAYKDSVFFNTAQPVKPVSNDVPLAPGSDYVKLTYTVKSGDVVGLIADWYDVRTSDLEYWNNIRRNIIRSGQKLAIYKHKSVADKYKDVNDLSYAEKQARQGRTVSKPATANQNTVNDLGDNYTVYTVKNGDTLWDIAKLYPGVSDTDIMRWNNISNAGSIKPGQKLKIKTKT